MKRFLLMSCTVFILSGCGADLTTPTPELRDTPRAAMAVAATSVTPETPRLTNTPTPDEVGTAYAVIAFDQATSTAEAAATSTSAVLTATQEAKSTEAFWAGVTMQVATQQLRETHVVGTQQAGTQQAAANTAAPQTATALKATQIVESNDLNSKVASMWIWRVGFAVFLTILLIAFGSLLYRSIPIAEELGRELGNAKVMKQKTDALKGADLVPSSVLKRDEKLIVPKLAHRSAIDPHHDDLTTEQAMQNTKSLRELKAVEFVSQSPLMSRYLARDMHKQGMPPFSVNITKPATEHVVHQPANPLISGDVLPALPAPHFKTLFAWDGNLLPFGVGEDGELMRADLTKRPHLMVCGMSGSWKSRSAIRTLAACALIQGNNVFVIGKQVDFFPFEGHPNFKIMPTRDMRKDSAKYVSVVRRMADEMNLRDDILVANRQSTWDRYGGPETIFILDDFTGLMIHIPDKDRAAFLDEILRIAMDGRKYGFNLLLGVQRPTADVFNSTLRSQLSRIAFRVEKASESKIAIDADGAQYLPDHHFFTRLSTESPLERGVGFTLEDNETEAFWRSRPIKENEPMSWIDAATAKEEESPAAPVTAETVSRELANAYQTADRDFQIRESYLKKKGLRKPFSLRQIEVEVFGSTGGAAHDTVKEVIANLEGCKAEEVASLMKEEFAQWKDEDLATTRGATTGESAPFLDDSEPVAA